MWKRLVRVNASRLIGVRGGEGGGGGGGGGEIWFFRQKLIAPQKFCARTPMNFDWAFYYIAIVSSATVFRQIYILQTVCANIPLTFNVKNDTFDPI